MKKDKLHFEVALFRDLSKPVSLLKSINRHIDQGSAIWSSFEAACDETSKYLKRNYVTIKRNEGSMLYTNPKSLSDIVSELSHTGFSYPKDVFELNVKSIRICELQKKVSLKSKLAKKRYGHTGRQDTAGSFKKQKTWSSGSDGFDFDNPIAANTEELSDNEDANIEQGGYLNMTDVEYINLEEVSLVFHFYCPFNEDSLESHYLDSVAENNGYKDSCMLSREEVGNQLNHLKQNRDLKRSYTSELFKNIDGLNNTQPLERLRDGMIETPTKSKPPANQGYVYNIFLAFLTDQILLRFAFE